MSEIPFPSTPVSWITAHLAGGGEGGRSTVNHWIMRIYFRPLREYFDCTRERWLSGGTEIVHGFFADRLDRPEFFAGWQSSGKSLRKWLKNGFSFYLKEESRRRQRDSRVPRADRLPPRTPEPSPEDVFDRVYAREVVRLALERTRIECEREGLDLHWRVFIEHCYRGIPYAECAPTLGLTEEQAAVKARPALRRFRSTVRELIARDRFAPGRIDDEIRALLEVTN